MAAVFLSPLCFFANEIFYQVSINIPDNIFFTLCWIKLPPLEVFFFFLTFSWLRIKMCLTTGADPWSTIREADTVGGNSSTIIKNTCVCENGSAHTVWRWYAAVCRRKKVSKPHQQSKFISLAKISHYYFFFFEGISIVLAEVFKMDGSPEDQCSPRLDLFSEKAKIDILGKKIKRKHACQPVNTVSCVFSRGSLATDSWLWLIT